MNGKKIGIIVLVLFGFISGNAQSNWYNQQWTNGKIDLETKKLLEPAKVLYIAAHPDDENTRLIAYLENVKFIDVGYLSLTNGMGGQNLISNELGEGHFIYTRLSFFRELPAGVEGAYKLWANMLSLSND